MTRNLQEIANKGGFTVLSGILYGLSFPCYPEYPTGVLAWFAFVPILWATKQPTSFKKYILLTLPALIIGIALGFWWTAIYDWKALLFCLFSQVPLIYLPFVLHFFLQRKFGFLKSLILIPFHFTLFESILHFIPHNLQVHSLAYTQANNIWFIQFIDHTGMWGATFWVMAINIGITLLILNYQSSKVHFLKAIILLLLLIAAPFCYSFWTIKINPKGVLGLGNYNSKVSIIQTNIDSYQVADSTHIQKVFKEIVSLSDSAVRTQQPDLIVLPEGAIPYPLFQDKGLFDFTKNAINAWQTSVAIGFVEYPNSSNQQIFRNNAMVFTPQLAMAYDSLHIKPEDIKVYQKEYGLPFFEFMPYRNILHSLTNRHLEPGHTPYIFTYTNFNKEVFKVALTICWEQMYPKKMAELVDLGADYITLMNNDAWFGKSPGSKQLLSFTRMRAIENRRSIVRCSNGGISCFIDPFGRISNTLPWYTSTIGTSEVICVKKKSFYTQHPLWFPILSGVLFLLLFLIYSKNSE